MMECNQGHRSRECFTVLDNRSAREEGTRGRTHLSHEVSPLPATDQPLLREVFNVVSHIVTLDLRILRRRPVEGRVNCKQCRDWLTSIQRSRAFLHLL